jgi:hypothetical protein
MLTYQWGNFPPTRSCASQRQVAREPSPVRRLAKLLHHDPVALDFVQIELIHRGRLGRRHVRGLDLAEDFTHVAKQDDAPPAPNPAGELGGAVLQLN